MYNMTLCFLWVYMRKYLVHVLLTLMSVEKNPQFSQESREIKHLKLWRCKNELISCQRRSIPRDQYIIGIAYTLKQEIQKLNMTESRIKSDINHPAWSLTEILPIMHWPEQAVLGWTVDQWSTRELAHLLSAGWGRVHTPIVSIWSFTWSNFCWSAQDEWPALSKQKSRLACHRSKRSLWTCMQMLLD